MWFVYPALKKYFSDHQNVPVSIAGYTINLSVTTALAHYSLRQEVTILQHQNTLTTLRTFDSLTDKHIGSQYITSQSRFFPSSNRHPSSAMLGNTVLSNARLLALLTWNLMVRIELFSYPRETDELFILQKFIHENMQSEGILRLEKWANKNLITFKGKCKVLCTGRNTPIYQCKLRVSWGQNRLAEKHLGILGVEKLAMSQRYALAGKSAGLPWEKHCQGK